PGGPPPRPPRATPAVPTAAPPCPESDMGVTVEERAALLRAKVEPDVGVSQGSDRGRIAPVSRTCRRRSLRGIQPCHGGRGGRLAVPDLRQPAGGGAGPPRRPRPRRAGLR